MDNNKDILENIREIFSKIGDTEITGNEALDIINRTIDKLSIPNDIIEAQKYVLECQKDIGFMGSPEYDKQKKIVDDYNDGIKEKEEIETYLRLKSKYENL